LGFGGIHSVNEVISMLRTSSRTAALTLGVFVAALSISGAASAQPSNPDANGAPPPGQGAYNVPPPPGYQPGEGQADTSAQARAEDDRYSYEAERWAARNCVAERANDTAAGAVIGGLFGAIVGSGLAGRHEHAAGAIVGGTAGAIAGGAIGSSAAASNPNCPPGYGLRPGAEPFYPGPIYGPVIYAAPGWYDPWLWYGGHWIYRPYPYHRYWYRTHPR
jgi:hypothetical protein